MAKGKLRPYAILTTDSTRIEVKAYNVEDAYRKAQNELEKFNKQFAMEHKEGKLMDVSDKARLTSAYMTFGKEGISYKGWGMSPTSQKMAKKYGGTYGLQEVANLGW